MINKIDSVEINKIKSESRTVINLRLLGISFTLFTFIAAISPFLLKENILLSLQLTIAIPLLITSIFARKKLAYTEKIDLWNKYGFITSTIALAFLLNVVGIFLSVLVGKNVSLIFYASNILIALLYSLFEIHEDKSLIKSRICKDSLFIIILFFLGILPALGIY
ncbi:hypothetical protein JW977_04475 [Candidatus Falkowbacteria bacterium]|nr:hypothetical protein [Candidatus Falkowbacteria bacterium]